jgi:hypothetical protein
MKESRGNPLSHNGNRETGDNSFGLFQVNMIDSLGPDRREKFNLEYNAQLLNPVVNAQIAFHMSKQGENWRAWKGVNNPVVRGWLKQFPESRAKALAKAKAKAIAEAGAEVKAIPEAIPEAEAKAEAIPEKKEK